LLLAFPSRRILTYCPTNKHCLQVLLVESPEARILLVPDSPHSVFKQKSTFLPISTTSRLAWTPNELSHWVLCCSNRRPPGIACLAMKNQWMWPQATNDYPSKFEQRTTEVVCNNRRPAEPLICMPSSMQEQGAPLHASFKGRGRPSCQLLPKR
jgi:hypothetical protein